MKETLRGPESDSASQRRELKRRAEREALIMASVQAEGYVPIEKLAEICGTSTQTIRRDLAALSAEGKVERYHGGACLPTAVAPPPDSNFAKRSAVSVTEKAAAASLLADLIPDGASLFLSGGSTLAIAADVLSQRENLVVVTNNLQAALRLYDQESFQVLVAGGWIRTASGSLIGEDTINAIDRFSLDFCIISTASISPLGAILERDQSVAAPIVAMLQRARRKVLVVDGSKFNARGIVRTAFLHEMDYVLTDRPPPPHIKNLIDQSDTKLLVKNP
ncbi:MAG TPA: DeoR/GlpR family DNA-binding transcription regulator [Kaistia sp.]|nr:DeoR/GlpR family DNA-binding transcription regulator [Kaistia sp.]